MQKRDYKKALVLFSGGQDSSTVLAWALSKYDQVDTVGFDYGQRHIVELGARRTVRQAFADHSDAWKDRLGKDMLIDFAAFGRLGETAMTTEVEITTDDDGMPSTFVPGRNLAFLIFAGAAAYRSGAGVLVAGMSQADYSGYPDCRKETLEAQMQALCLGMDTDIRLETPLMHISKADTWQLAEDIGGDALVDVIVEHSHTCYLGARDTRHVWGYGCGDCPACGLRAAGWAAYKGDGDGDGDGDAAPANPS
ncbi:MAG: 7-cyano-7-deazaguanine synthase QueC [Pseudomonadota bacterium]